MPPSQKVMEQKKDHKNRMNTVLVVLLPIPTFLVLWEIIARSGIYNIYLFPPPSVVFGVLFESIKSGELPVDLYVSLKRAAIGFLLGSGVGIFLGFLTGWWEVFYKTIGQLIQLFRPIPPIAIIPLVLLLAGIGETSKYFIIFWGVFFPMWLNTHEGVAGVEAKYIWAAKSLGAGNREIFYEIILPAASPFIIIAARIGIAVSLICLVAAEMSGASEGIGFRISHSYSVFRVDKMMANLLILGVLGAIFDRLFVLVRDKVMPWYQPMTKK